MAYFDRIFQIIFLICAFVPLTLTKCTLIQNECIHVQQRFGMKVDNCIKLLSADSEASKATNIKHLTLISLKFAEKSSEKIYSRIEETLSKDKLSPDMKPVIEKVASYIKEVVGDFRSAHGDVEKSNDFMTANYDVMLIHDAIKNAKGELGKVKGEVDPFYQQSFELITSLQQINIVLTDDGDMTV